MMKHRHNLNLKISHLSLEAIFSQWNIKLPPDNLILFAFRGFRPIKTISDWKKEIILEPKDLDYNHMHCTIGIWNRSNKKIFVARGSTVPFADNVMKAAKQKGKYQGKGVNQLEPGFYTDLTKGEHLQGKLNGHEALRQTANRFYRRSLKGFPYTNTDKLYFGNPYDNLHCGWNLKGDTEGYSSAGCLVVAGLPHCHRQDKPQPNQGAWKNFHRLLYAEDQKNFSLLLLKGQDAVEALASLKKKPSMCYGSSGLTVRLLQAALKRSGFYKGMLNGKLDAITYKAWNKSGFKKYAGVE
jgi:hypothetical protein